jgi:hypothetical protein
MPYFLQDMKPSAAHDSRLIVRVNVINVGRQQDGRLVI